VHRAQHWCIADGAAACCACPCTRLARGAAIGGGSRWCPRWCTLARLLTGLGSSADGSHEAQSLLVGLVFGGIAAGFFWLRERNAKLEAELQARELARLEAEKQSLAAQLRLLQAQIEPHFLFNSLANVAALIEADPKLAGRLLDALIRYLRASLHAPAPRAVRWATRWAAHGLSRCAEDPHGRALDYAFDIRSGTCCREFPPMLLQPLVENAIRHGLEPKVGGGMLRVVAALARRDAAPDGVSDDGVGFAKPDAGRGRRPDQHPGTPCGAVWSLGRAHHPRRSRRWRHGDAVIPLQAGRMKAIIADDEPAAGEPPAKRAWRLCGRNSTLSAWPPTASRRGMIEDLRRSGLSRHPHARPDRAGSDAGPVAGGARGLPRGLRHGLRRVRGAGLRAEAVDYLLKPVSDERLGACVERLKRAGPRSAPTISCSACRR
jgi:hypothetical protein